MPGRRRIPFALVVLLLLCGAGGVALTAANVVPNLKAGDGQGTITGYVLSSVQYAVNGTNPALIDSLTFTLDSTPPTGSTIQARLDSVGGTWYSCTNVTTSVTCNTTVGTQATVAAADSLRVIIVD